MVGMRPGAAGGSGGARLIDGALNRRDNEGRISLEGQF